MSKSLRFARIESTDGHIIDISPCNLASIEIDGKVPVAIKNEEVIDFVALPDKLMITTDHPMLSSCPPWGLTEKLDRGNVLALSTSGELLWRIEDLDGVGDFCYPFCGGYVIPKPRYEEFASEFGVEMRADHDYYIAHNMTQDRYLIDLTDTKFVKKSWSRW